MTLQEIWEQVMPPERRWLGLVIFGSLLVHLAGFFVFRVDPVNTRAYVSRPRQATLMTPGLEMGPGSGGNWIQWLDWRDPSAIALPWSPLAEPSIPELKPSTAGSVPLPDMPASPAVLPRDLPGSLPEKADKLINGTTRQPMPIRVESPPPLSGTAYRLEGKISDRRILGKPVLPKPRTDLSLKVTILGVGIDRRGEVVSALVEESSGDGTVDQTAVQAVQSWLFAPRSGGSEVDWGRVVVFWDLNEKLAEEPAKTP